MVRVSLDIAFSPALPNDISTWVHFSATPWYGASITFKGGTTERQHFDLVYDLSGASSSYKTDNVFIRFTNSFPLNTIVSIKNANLYISTAREDYRPAVEEFEEALDTKADQALTLEQKRELEERMGIIESELKARALLAETDAWFDEYTKYKTGLATDKAESETKLTTLSNRVDTAVKDLGNMSVRWNFLDTYMKPGNEGLMIGKIDGSTSIRVSDNRIAFYSGGKEVAFISNDTLEIENGIFTTQLQVGRFQTSQYGPNPDANIVRYVG
jgi:hypothetical protein